MRLTNKLGLPQPIVDAVANDPYSRGNSDVSVTQLISPPRKIALDIQHADALEEDVSDRIFSLLGQTIHSILERADKTGEAERRLSIKVGGWTISGAMDRYVGGLLQDYKCVTVWKFKDGEVPIEYEQQLNCYAEILRQNGFPVRRLEVVGILRDWSKLEALRSGEGYPQQQVVVRTVKLWSDSEAQHFIRDRVVLHQQARVQLPECSAEERWQKPDVFAVAKPEAKRSLRNYDTLAEAEAHVAKTPGLVITKRYGISVRCQSYCSASQFCTQFRSFTEEPS